MSFFQYINSLKGNSEKFIKCKLNVVITYAARIFFFVNSGSFDERQFSLVLMNFNFVPWLPNFMLAQLLLSKITSVCYKHKLVARLSILRSCMRFHVRLELNFS